MSLRAKKKAPSRKPRADAERNREALLRAAKTVLAAKGAAATLEEIARTADVGIGTLYRHFPTRENLIGAVYSHEIEQVIAAAEELSGVHRPLDALREWLFLFIDFMESKHALSDIIISLGIVKPAMTTAAPERIRTALTQLVDRATKSGDIEMAVEPYDLVRALYGLRGEDGWRERAIHMVDILIAGITKRTPVRATKTR